MSLSIGCWRIKALIASKSRVGGGEGGKRRGLDGARTGPRLRLEQLFVNKRRLAKTSRIEKLSCPPSRNLPRGPAPPDLDRGGGKRSRRRAEAEQGAGRRSGPWIGPEARERVNPSWLWFQPRSRPLTPVHHKECKSLAI